MTPPRRVKPTRIVLLNTSIMNLSAPYTQNGSKYSIYSTVLHEMNECLGISSALSGLSNGAAAPTGAIFPEDLFRYDAAGNRSFNTAASAAAYFSIDGTTDLARFNQQQGGDFNDWYSYFGGVTPQVQDAYSGPGVSPVMGTELTVLDALGYSLVVGSPATLTWDASSAAGIQDGAGTWNTSGTTFSNGTTSYAWTNGSSLNAVFGAGNGAAGVVTLGANITAQTITFNAPGSGSYNIAGGGFTLSLTGGATITSNVDAAISAPLSVTGGLLKNGVGNLTLSGNTTATGAVTIAAGTLTLAGGTFTAASIGVQSGGSLSWSTGTLSGTPIAVTGTFNLLPNTGAGFLLRPLNAVTINSGGQVNAVAASNHANRQYVVASGLTIAGSTNAWQGLLDLANNDLDVQGGSLATITNQVKTAYAAGAWTGNGITSSTAKADANHLTTLGVILNGNTYGTGAGSLGTFDGQNPAAADVLVKYTYFGDANLDGKVDGSDYARIDFGFIAGASATGWQNGDFNYDGSVDGSDYALIDNTYNRQTVNLNTASLRAAASVEPAAVPEPASMVAVTVAAAMSGRRRRRG